MFDRRFPNLVRVGEARSPRLSRAASEIERRTDARVVLQRWKSGECHLFVYPSDPAFGYALPPDLTRVVRRDGTQTPPEGARIDDIVRMIQHARRPLAQQDREMRASERSAETAAEQATGRANDGKRKEAEKIMRRHKNREGMGKHFRGSAVVSGFKGGGQ